MYATGSKIPDCLDEAHRCLSVVGGSLVALLQDLNTPPECLPPLQLELERLENEARSLRCNLEAVLSAMNESQRDRLPSPRVTTVMAEKKDEVVELRRQVHDLQAQQLQLQRESGKASAQLSAQLAVTQGEAARLRSQLTHQSAFCASLGAVLGNLVWKASRVPPVVDLLLTGNKVADFLCIVSGTLESFLETFDTEMPGPSADESQFIMAMGGIVTNMAAAPAGRQFLVSDPNGRDLILQIIRILPVIPTPSGNCLKRLLLMALYNISINQAGLSLLHEEGKGTIFTVATNCLRPEATNELQIMALRLLLSLTCEMNSPALLAKVPNDLITEIANSDDLQLKSMAQEVKENLLKVQERIKQAAQKHDRTAQPARPLVEPPLHVDNFGNDKRPMGQPTTWRLPSHQ